jgi:alpha-glucuronidase
MRCICGSENIAKNVDIYESGPEQTGRLKAAYNLENPGKWIFSKVIEGEPVLADICRDCGTVRFYVQNLDRDWRFK